MKAKSIKGNSTEEIQLALEQNITDDFKPTLAFCFLSFKQDRKGAGFFSNAELARAAGGNLEMHSLTTCCVALKEK
ncbi:MAG: hypothetical protein ABJB11_21660 [Ferruginibacter sp.]